MSEWCDCIRCLGEGVVRSQSVDDMGGDVCPACDGEGCVPCESIREPENRTPITQGAHQS